MAIHGTDPRACPAHGIYASATCPGCQYEDRFPVARSLTAARRGERFEVRRISDQRVVGSATLNPHGTLRVVADGSYSISFGGKQALLNAVGDAVRAVLRAERSATANS